MSTTLNDLSSQSNVSRFNRLERFLDGVGDTLNLQPTEQLVLRLNALDDLDAIIGNLDLGNLETCPDPRTIARAKALRSQLEAANETLYYTARSEIALHGNSFTMHRWLLELAYDRNSERPRPGLSFDLIDEIVSGILRFRDPREAGLPQSMEMAPYQPTPARHILDLIAACRFSRDDILVDLGSGLGHVPLLVSILTGIRTLGVEIQPNYVANAEESAEDLNLRRVRFVAGDARLTDLSIGTVFYLFSPFTGSILADVLHQLSKQSQTRQIRICALGPCTRILQGQTWLAADDQPDSERIAVFKSR